MRSTTNPGRFALAAGTCGLMAAIGCSAGGASAEPDPGASASGGALAGAGGGVPQGGEGGGIVPPGSGGQTGAGGAPPAGAGGAPIAAGGTSPAVPFGGYDPNVTFDFPEVAATAGSCKAGRYSGKFDGLYTVASLGGLPVPIAGDVNLVLEQSQDGEFFTVADGNIAGFVYAIIPFSSGLQGTLNCKAGKLEGGFMPNGKYNVFGNDSFYEGPIDANYDKLTNAFVNGTWAVGEPTYQRGGPRPAAGGEGTWGANWVGP